MKEASLWYASFPNQEGAKALCCEHPGQAQCFPNSLGNGTLPEEIPALGQGQPLVVTVCCGLKSIQVHTCTCDSTPRQCLCITESLFMSQHFCQEIMLETTSKPAVG